MVPLAASTPLSPPPPPPLTKKDMSLCDDFEAAPICLARWSQCAPLSSLLTPLLGTPQTIIPCVNNTLIPLKSDFLADLAQAQMTGATKFTGKKPTDDPVANLAIQHCIVSASGMLGTDFLLNRTAIAGQVSQLSPPVLGAAVAAAVTTCPEPAHFSTKHYVKCLKKACLAAATPAPPTTSPGIF